MNSRRPTPSRRRLARRRLAMAPLVLALVAPIGAGAAGAAGAADATSAPASATQDERDVSEYNLGKDGLALGGYDPVAYFPEGGGEPAKGSKEHVLTHLGVTYRFSSEKNREAFRKDPERYEPAYGGWCAYSMAQGKQVDPSSKNFLIQGDRLHVFYKGLFANARDKWKKEGPEKLREKADANWAELTRKKGGRR